MSRKKCDKKRTEDNEWIMNGYLHFFSFFCFVVVGNKKFSIPELNIQMITK